MSDRDRREIELRLLRWGIVSRIALIGILAPIVIDVLVKVIVIVPKFFNLHTSGAIEIEILSPFAALTSFGFLLVFLVSYFRMLSLRRKL